MWDIARPQLHSIRVNRTAVWMAFRLGLRFETVASIGTLLVLGCSGSNDWTTRTSAGGSGASAGATASAGSGSTACNTCATAADCGSAMRCIGFEFPALPTAGLQENWALYAFTTKSTNCCRDSANTSQRDELTIDFNGDPQPSSSGGASGQQDGSSSGRTQVLETAGDWVGSSRVRKGEG